MAEAVPTTTDQATIAAATTGVEAPKEYSISFADGKVYKDTDPAKLASEAEKRYNSLYPEYEKLKGENANFRAQAEKMAGVQPANGGFDAAKYYSIWATDPIQADAYKRNFDPEWQKGLKAVEQSQFDRNVSIFCDKHPEFKPTQENAASLAKVCDQLYPGMNVLNPDQIEAAHLKAVQEKYYTVEQVGGNVPETPQKPPVPPANTTTANTQTINPEKLNQADLRAYIEAEAAKQK